MGVTNIDILQAKSGWAAAFESPATNDHVLDLYEDYVRLVTTQAQQITDSFSRPRLRVVMRTPPTIGLDIATGAKRTRQRAIGVPSVSSWTRCHNWRLPRPDGVVIAPTNVIGEPLQADYVDETVDAVSDLVLARRAGLGDRAAFAIIFDRHGAAMFRYAVRMLDGDLDGAEDAVQDALERAWSKLPGFRGEAQLHAWLFRITANVVLSSRRRRRPISVDDELLTALPAKSAAEPPGELERSELRAALEFALTELPWRQRAAWLLREMEGLSYDEIADVLGTSPTVVRGQLHRARGTLAVRMVQWR